MNGENIHEKCFSLLINMNIFLKIQKRVEASTSGLKPNLVIYPKDN